MNGLEHDEEEWPSENNTPLFSTQGQKKNSSEVMENQLGILTPSYLLLIYGTKWNERSKWTDEVNEVNEWIEINK